MRARAATRAAAAARAHAHAYAHAHVRTLRAHAHTHTHGHAHARAHAHARRDALVRAFSSWSPAPFPVWAASDRVRLSNCAFHGFHGVEAFEAEVGQRFEVDVELAADLKARVVPHARTYTHTTTKIHLHTHTHTHTHAHLHAEHTR